MKTKVFMEKYGNEILQQYNLPTAAEVKAMKRAEAGEVDSDSEDISEG
jgi:hypothetical protein